MRGVNVLKPKIFVTQLIPDTVKVYLENYFTVEIWEQQEIIPRETLYKKIQESEGLLTAGIEINQELLSQAINLKVVSNISVGYNNFDIEVMKENGIIGTNTQGVLDETVTDLIFGLMLSTARRINELDTYMRNGEWTSGDDRNLFGMDVYGQTLGIIGLGRIGESIVHRAVSGFNMDVLYHNRSRKTELEKQWGVQYEQMEDVLTKSDFVIVMTPLNKDTFHLIGKKQFELMKDTAIFINASRGPIVDELALIDALDKKKIFAAGLDVFEQEPINSTNPLLKLNNVVLTPHIGSATDKTREEMAQLAAENLVNAIIHKKHSNVVNELKTIVKI
ncbi:2-hydroxyacid dehydrogenase [Paenisporosarcina antarctica]|uniref:D-glycerate dehydrogenase n=1 Tax=Paenisporosarcina antarctica TaxID=417367 RepID=A0A4P7A1L2_9BACL|nr:D-glycerate dehydrogenase [Paenisporosarcina antarctica]QBP42484.1 D-glycerate dehydrogenase [Paenisporosarcina antarctica]